jgi:hypothetical protein
MQGLIVRICMVWVLTVSGVANAWYPGNSCAAGWYNTEGKHGCERCASGTRSRAGYPKCCPIGHTLYLSHMDDPGSCEKSTSSCPAGSYSIYGSDAADCSPCPEGFYSEANMFECERCASGTRSRAGDPKCCPIGYTLQTPLPTLTCGHESTSEGVCQCPDSGTLTLDDVITDGPEYTYYARGLRCEWIISGNNPWVEFSRFQLGSGAAVYVETCTQSTCHAGTTRDQGDTFQSGTPPQLEFEYHYDTATKYTYLLVGMITFQQRPGYGFSATWGADSGLGEHTCQASTSSCSAGWYSAYGSDAADCSRCPAGFYSEANIFECSECLPGTYRASREGPCEDCPVGTWSAAGQSFCPVCLPGYETDD